MADDDKPIVTSISGAAAAKALACLRDAGIVEPKDDKQIPMTDKPKPHPSTPPVSDTPPINIETFAVAVVESPKGSELRVLQRESYQSIPDKIAQTVKPLQTPAAVSTAKDCIER